MAADMIPQKTAYVQLKSEGILNGRRWHSKRQRREEEELPKGFIGPLVRSPILPYTKRDIISL